MSLRKFVTQLTEGGRIVVARGGLAGDVDDANAALAELDSVARLEMPHDAPALDPDVARWAATLLYDACALIVFREHAVDVLRSRTGIACPRAADPIACYSADLTLRYLPDVTAIALAVAEDDPLIGALRELGRQWPLSSVGMEGLGNVDPGAFLDDTALRTLYVDRILARSDTSRLDHLVVRSTVRAALGLHGELAPEIISTEIFGTETISKREPPEGDSA